MTEAQTASGSCLCGAVRFTARLPSLFCAHCHCTMCQRNHGAAFVTWFSVPPDALRVEEGADELVRYASSAHGTRTFCRTCGSSLFCTNSEHPDRVDIPLAAMSEPIDRAPQVHVFYDSHAPWVSPTDGLPRLGGETGLEPVKDETKAEKPPR
jgi:hypothetical protein